MVPSSFDALYAGVLDLQARYAQALDAGDLTALEACFTSDAVLSVDGSVVEQGAAAIAERLTSRVSSDAMHLTIGTSLTGASASAVDASSYFLMLDTSSGKITSAGRYQDRITVTDEDGASLAARSVTYRWRADRD